MSFLFRMPNNLLYDILKNVGTSRLIRLGGRYFGRTTNVIGWGVGALSSVKTFKTYTRKDPYNKLIAPLEEELNKWSSAISCIGRDPYFIGDICSIEKGGAINALGKKELLHISTRYPTVYDKPNMEYHAPQDSQENFENKKDSKTINPNPKEAKRLINLALEYLDNTIDKINIEEFEKKKKKITNNLRGINEKLPNKYKGQNYTPIQQELSDIVRKIIDIEFEYKSKILKLESKRNIRRLKYAGIAGLSFFAGTITGKKIK